MENPIIIQDEYSLKNQSEQLLLQFQETLQQQSSEECSGPVSDDQSALEPISRQQNHLGQDIQQESLSDQTNKQEEQQIQEKSGQFDIVEMKMEQFSISIKETDSYLNQLLEQLQKEKKRVNEQQQNKENSPLTLSHENLRSQLEAQTKVADQTENNSNKENSASHTENNSNILQQQSQPTQQISEKCSPQKQKLKQQQIHSLIQQQQNLNLNSNNPRNSLLGLREIRTSIGLQQSSINRQQKYFKDGTQIKDIIDVSQPHNIDYGNVIPGNIFEENLEIFNKSNESIAIKIFVLCLNSEYDDHDEYIFSVRKTSGYDYNERYNVLIHPFRSMQFNVALKVPNTTEKKLLIGSVQISVLGLANQIQNTRIKAQIDVPKILCTKELFAMDEKMKIIKLAIKKGKKQDSKIPFKNTHNKALTIETEQIDDGSECPYDFLIHPTSIIVQPNSMFIINTVLKPNNKYNNLINKNEKYEIRKVLLLKIKNSSVLFSFPILIEAF